MKKNTELKRLKKYWKKKVKPLLNIVDCSACYRDKNNIWGKNYMMLNIGGDTEGMVQCCIECAKPLRTYTVEQGNYHVQTHQYRH